MSEYDSSRAVQLSFKKRTEGLTPAEQAEYDELQRQEAMRKSETRSGSFASNRPN